MTLNKLKAIRILGLLAAVATAAAAALSGDFTTALGIIGASVSSATVLAH